MSTETKYSAGWIATGILLVVYGFTLAPGVTLWDSGEFLAAVHTLGIPHPPGTPLYVLIARIWSEILSPVLGFARSVNLLSAVSTAVACGLLASLFQRWMKSFRGAVAAAVCAGSMSTLWLSSNETEVYALAFLMSILLLWTAAHENWSSSTKACLLLYLAGLAWSLHLAALVTLPAALYLLRPRLSDFNYKFVAVLALGMSPVLFMIIRAQHDPAINQGNPATWQALWDVITRAQYEKHGLWPRQAPVYLQLGNLIEYADWQVALGLAPDAPPSWLRTPFTILFFLLGVYGCVQHKKNSRETWRAMMFLFVCATLGLIAYLNLKAGPTYGFGVLPDSAPREARDRDYFFILAFVCWGLWAGLGAVKAFRNRWLGVVVAMLPVLLNWKAVDRSRDNTARARAINLLSSAPKGAVLDVIGDNNTYPVWYMQQVEGYRTDVTVITTPLLAAKWYREELNRRHGIKRHPQPMVR